jgi:hypothetical protein
MPRIKLENGTTYTKAKKIAGRIITNTLEVNSVRIVVKKETNEMWIEYTTFPQKTVDKLNEM